MTRRGRPQVHVDPQRTSIILDRADLEELDGLREEIDCTRSEYLRGVVKEHLQRTQRTRYTLARAGSGVLLSNDSGGATYGPKSTRAELWNLVEQIVSGLVEVEQ